MTSAVSVAALHKRYPNVHALRGIDLEIRQGEFFGLLGPNGAGKSTLINVLAGLVKPSSGSAAVLGHDVQRDYRAARLSLGVVPQELLYDPFFRVREMLRLQAGYFGLGRNSHAWVDELMERLHLSDKADASLQSLSGGMKRRVLIAQALVHRPPVIVLDEPTAGVDVALRQGLWQLTRELHREGHTIILTTHYLEEAEFLADRVGVISRGRMLIEGAPRDLQQAHGQRVMSVDIVGGGSGVDEDLQAGLSQALAGVAEEIEWIGSRVHVTSSDTNAALERLTKWAAASGVILNEWSIERPSLEQVFLKVNSDEIEGGSRG